MAEASDNAPLSILCLEDNAYDRQLLVETLAAEGLRCKFVHTATREEFETALSGATFDLILSDNALPAYSGMAALAHAREVQPETPFVLFSGTIGEERAVESLKAGATDCVLKENLDRLGPAIHRALREAKERTRRKSVEESLHALTARLQASREEERMKIAREIHDELGQALTGMKLGLTWIRRRLYSRAKAVPRKQVFAKIDELGALADATADRVRKICAELRPNILDDLGLVPAIQWQAREFQSRTNIRCSMRLPDALDVPEDQATAIFRIFQEILTNVARHARANAVLISLKKTATSLQLRVADNGCGIEPAAIGSNQSLGLLGMRERAALLGGKLEIRGLPGRGTTVHVTLPLAASAVGANYHFNSHQP
jgi:signal transduction histidine kinase